MSKHGIVFVSQNFRDTETIPGPLEDTETGVEDSLADDNQMIRGGQWKYGHRNRGVFS